MREFYRKTKWKNYEPQNKILQNGLFKEYYSKITRKKRIILQKRVNFTRFEEKKAKPLEKSQNKILKEKSFEE